MDEVEFLHKQLDLMVIQRAKDQQTIKDFREALEKEAESLCMDCQCGMAAKEVLSKHPEEQK